MQLGPISRHPARPHPLEQHALARASFGVAFAESGADDADRAGRAWRCSRRRPPGPARRGHDDHGEIDRPGNVGDARVGGQPFDLADAVGCTGTIVPVNPARDQVVEDLRADLAAFADWRRPRRPTRGSKNGLHRRRRGGARSRRRLLRELLGDRERQRRRERPLLDQRASSAKPESRNTSSIRRLSPST